MLGFYKIRYLLLLLTLLAGVYLWPGVQSALMVDNSLTAWFLEDDPALTAYHDFQERFGNDEVVVVMVNDGQTLLTPDYFGTFVNLTNALEAIPDVERVIGPGNTNIPVGELFGVSLVPLLTADTNPGDVRDVLASQPTLREQLFSRDYKTARFLIVLRASPDFDRRRGEILDRIRATAGRQLPNKSVFSVGSVSFTLV